MWLLMLLGLLATGACALQTTTCDTTERQRAAVAREALSLLEDEYNVIEGKLSFPPFAQPAGRYGLVSFDGREVNPPALCEITDSVNTPYGNGLCNFTIIVGPRVRTCLGRLTLYALELGLLGCFWRGNPSQHLN